MHSTEPKRFRVLLVEDDEAIVDAIRDGFPSEGVLLRHAPTLAEGCRLLTNHHFDAIVLDRNLPDGEGTMIAKLCRQAGNDIPIVIVSAKDTVNDRIEGLRCGADDYLCKPFAVEELSARLDAVLRRTHPKHRHIIRYHDVELDLLRRRLRRGEIDKALSSREVDLLAYLMTHPEEVIPKEQLFKDIWGTEADQDSNVLQVYANYLRNKLEGGLYPRIIHTVRGVGYILSYKEPFEEMMEYGQ